MKSIFRFLIFYCFVFCLSNTANAQYGGYQSAPSYEGGDFLEKYWPKGVSTGLTAYDEGLLGDNIDVDTGRLSFRQADIDIPGNSDLSVSLGRRLSTPRYDEEQKAGFADWMIDMPYIRARLETAEAVFYPPYYNENIWPSTRCSSRPMNWSNIQYGPVQKLTPYWDGLNIYTPGDGERKIFEVRSDDTRYGADRPPKATPDYWKIKCLATATDIYGEGYLAIAPNGTKYYFDVFRKFKGRNHTLLLNGSTFNSSNYLMFPSKIEDVNGNWVKYNYNSHGPTRIYSSDGREITVQYDSQKRITSAKANGRTWNYKYNTASGALERVTLPDAKYWQFNPNLGELNQVGENACNNWVDYVRIKHPDGVVGEFWLRQIKNGIVGAGVSDPRINTPTFSHLRNNFSLCTYTTWATQPVFFSNAVTKKRLTVPGSGTHEWIHQYEEDEGSLVKNNNFNDYKTRSIILPDGSKRKYYIDRKWGVFLGKLQKTETYSSANSNTPLETTIDTYSPLGGAWHSSGSWYVNFVSVIYQNFITPLVKREVKLDGDTYTQDFEYNYSTSASNFSFGKPVKTKSYSNVSTSPRIIDTEYEHKKSVWVLGLPKKVTQNARVMATYVYDGLGRKTSQTRYGQHNASFTYHTAAAYKGAPYKITDALGRRTELREWKRGTPQRVRRAAGTPDEINAYQYVDNNGWVTSIKDAMGRTTGYTHDNMGRVTLINPPGNWANTSISYNFNGGGAVQTITKGQARTTISYDGMFRPILERKQALDTGWSSYTRTEYDGLGRPTFKSQPSTNSNETKGMDYTYDGLGRIYQERENVSPYATTKHRYYSSHRHRVYDPSGAWTQYYSYGYDGPGNTNYRAIYKYANGAYQQYTYLYKNVHGQMTRLRQWGNTDGYNVNKSQYFYYDGQQRLCRHYVPEHGATKYQYDPAGQTIAYAKGQSNSGCGAVPNVSAKVSKTYDNLGRLKLTNFTDPATDDISLTYDANSNLKTVYRGGVNWSYNYNDINLLTHEYLDVDGRNYDSNYTYNNAAYLTRKRLPSGRYINYTPDGLGRIKTVKNGSTTLASNTTFHASGAITGMRYGNGQLFTQTLNNRLLPQRLLSYKGGTRAIDKTYSYDARGKVTSISDGAGTGDNRTYAYDGLGRLTSASGPWGTGSFKYDALNNLRQKKLGSRTVNLTYDSRNRLSRSADTGASGTRTVAYDAQGNVTTLGNLGFIYDYSDQPVVVSGTANGVGSANGAYTYDGNLKRVKSVVNGKTIYNVYDVGGNLVHVDAVTDNKKTDYITGPNGSLARYTNNVITYLHPNHLGSAVTGTTSTGGIRWREKYTPFGEEMQSPAANDNLAGFTGHIKDKATGLNYMQARYYDPVIGRFLSVDPVGFNGSGQNTAYFNRYAYSGNDPINYIDPDGQFFGIIGKLIKLGVKGGDVGATVAGAVADTKTIFSKDATGLQRVGAVASLATEIFSPVSARDAKSGAKFAKKKLGGKCCFVAGTLVETEYGLRPIEEIELGDHVLARNPDTGETSLKAVTDLIRLNERQIWEVVLEGDNNTSEFFETTDDHPWWIVDLGGKGSWKNTAELSVGMVVTTADNKTMTITSVSETDRIDATYNLTVADFETYFVGENKVLVHNCKVSPHIDPKDVAGKSPSEIDQFAKSKGLDSRGSDPSKGRGSYTDPVTGEQRVLIHPNANCGPHCHVNNPAGERLDINGNIVPPESPAAHLPLDTTKP